MIGFHRPTPHGDGVLVRLGSFAPMSSGPVVDIESRSFDVASPARPTNLRRLFVAFTAAVAVLACGFGSAEAHSGKQSYLYVSLFDDGVEGRVEIPAVDLSSALGIEIPRNVEEAEAAIADEAPAIREYIAANTSLGDDDGTWRLDVADEGKILATENGLYVTFDVDVDETFDEAPDTFVAEFSVIIESDPERDALLIIENDWSSANFANEGEHLLGFSVGMTEQLVEIETVSTLTAVGEVRGLGTDAVRTGIDLMLIVVALTLMLTMDRRPASTADRTARVALTFIVTFTLTLWASGLGLVDLDQRAAGIAVALTLAATAIAAGFARFGDIADRSTVGLTALVGLGFGIGLGSAFVDAGLGRRRSVLGLIAFEAGAVVAIAIVVACVVVPMLLLRSRRWGDLLTVGLAAVLTAYAIAWLGERGLSEEWPIEEVANPLRVWPRNLWFVALAIGAALLLRRFTAPTASPSVEESSSE
jgi:hypothetical protein